MDDVKRKILALRGLELDPSVIQPVASRYTNYAISAPLYMNVDSPKTEVLQLIFPARVLLL
jgi:hypothetical protein